MSGKVAVVTGGSRGLGREMVLAFAQCGADVVIASRKLEQCIAAAKEVEKLGRRALPIAFNANSWADCNRLYEETYKAFGKCDVLVNNAGGSPLYSSLVEHSEALYDKVLALNLKGPFRLSALFGTRMSKEGGGSIINVSSTASQRVSQIELPYGMAKAGLNMMTTGMAKAFGPKVRVNVIVPGPFLTDISKAWDMDAFNKRAQVSIPLGRGGQANEIVGAALLLATEAGSYITGAILNVDGGPPKSDANADM
ncbi:short chain dehydrogenase/reductase SDR [Gonapodya prolifera JEL478]|uniref:Short chain dehydrogenase/reductase SDR n=1 Tax=Gonapodya prolifera (strain JEL478) TaxID=1344416 RepID=A0A139AW02_GONPJ|nr:short chain dehydrogenase/reductase SDR [Gonapodya prolifera JEL478]|eukprot:KXS20763.1 short chain dehydrogenase/reductase SDR [Gonapodya prolifera JEL478]